jgi:DNA-binding GntR family transcriptional regulator
VCGGEAPLDARTSTRTRHAPERRTGAPRSPTGRARRITAAARIHAALWDEIASLKRRPGEPISERDVSLAHGVSRTPVREAILRLADEGLVEIFPQSGTFVARIPLAALPEAIVIRKALEETAARLAAEHATREQLAALKDLVERQRALSTGSDREAFHAADEAFHAALADAAGYPGMWRLVQQVKVQVDRYRRLTLPQPGRMALVTKEHAAVLAAIRRRDGATAAARMGLHIERLLADLAGIRDLNPDHFVDTP